MSVTLNSSTTTWTFQTQEEVVVSNRRAAWAHIGVLAISAAILIISSICLAKITAGTLAAGSAGFGLAVTGIVVGGLPVALTLLGTIMAIAFYIMLCLNKKKTG